jgi:hypothetical protein
LKPRIWKRAADFGKRLSHYDYENTFYFYFVFISLFPIFSYAQGNDSKLTNPPNNQISDLDPVAKQHYDNAIKAAIKSEVVTDKELKLAIKELTKA